jgi:hypothetical protein
MLKTFYSFSRIEYKPFCLSLFVFMFAMNLSQSQVQNNGIIQVLDKTSFCISAGNLILGALPAQTATSRSSSNYGKIVFGTSSGFTGASNNHFISGYATTVGNTWFLCPVGQSGVYAPASVMPAAIGGVDVAYYRAAPSTLGTALDGTVGAVSGIEYWDIKSNNQALISLSWRSSSNITSLTSSTLSNLIIAGWNGTKWVQIPSTVDVTAITGGASSLTSGSITSNSNVVLSGFSAFTLAKKGDCNPLIAPSGNTITWNGVWSPAVTPTLADAVIIAAPYSGSLSCNSLTLNSNITLANGEFVEIVNGATGAGKIIMSSEASVVQRNGNSTAPAIELTKRTRNMRQLDYVYFGTPIAGNFFSQLDAAKATTVLTTGAFDLKYRYQSGAGGGWQVLSSTTSGNGFIMRVKAQAPFLTANAVDKIDLKFSGTANNGDLSVSVAQNATNPNGGTSHNLLANPYPSAIDGDLFLRTNTTIDGVIYVWQQATAAGTVGATSYTQADYLAYTRVGSVAPSPITGTFDGKIASGQSFKVKALSTGLVTFTNCMRLTNNNTNFYRQSNENVMANTNRFKLTMTGGQDNVFSQILVAYLPECTVGYDRMYDAGRNSVSTSQLYSVLETDQQKLAINAKPVFVSTDVVTLGMSKTDTNLEQYTINIEQKEGVFANGQSVYLHDKTLNVYHDFGQGAYQFYTSNQSNDNATIKSQTLFVSANKNISKIEIFDITGKKIAHFDVKNNKEFISNFNFSEGIYIAKIKLDGDETISQKLINTK